ncbi:MAG: hypothetical protein KC546_13205 [Anaerolineae bacterium]|nr:hypothetical protein [Anaerolineae bacterium]MCA9894067.1 hypothetical protein [Anaerolineae bacterium]
MPEVQIKLAALWIMLMLIYLVGDILRLFSGDTVPGEVMGSKMTQPMLMFMAIFMLIPILMIWVSLTVDQPINRWANIIVPALFFLFNLVGIPSYPGLYDKFLLVISLIFNLMSIWTAWNWSI